MWLHFTDHVVDVTTQGAQVSYPTECTDGYMQWFHKILDPYIIPPREGDSPWVPVVQVHEIVARSESTSSGAHSSEAKFERISKVLQSILDRRMASEGMKAWDLT